MHQEKDQNLSCRQRSYYNLDLINKSPWTLERISQRLLPLGSGSVALTDPCHPRRLKQPAEVLRTAPYRLYRRKVRQLYSHQAHPCKVTQSLRLLVGQGLLQEQVQFKKKTFPNNM